MRMNLADTRTYPKFAYYVRVNIPQVIHVPAIVSAFRRIGGIDRPTLRQALIWGSGPSIRITPLVGANGEFTPNIGSQEIRIDRGIVQEFEAGRGVQMARAGRVYLVGTTLLHELIHWADDQDGIDRAGEEGVEFEVAMYGRDID
jgi:Metallopeptidase toxin 3